MGTLQDLLVKVGVDPGGVDKGTKEIQSKFEKTWAGVQKTAAVAGAAVGAAIAVGVAGAMEFDTARAKLAAQVGDPALADRLGKVAGKVYADGFGESAGGAMDAVQAVVSSHLAKVNDAGAIEAMTKKVQAYATAWGDDVAEAAKYVSSLLGSGLVKDANEAMDLITVASGKVPAALRGDLLEASNEYGQFFNSLGFNGSQAFGLLVEASEKGTYGIDKAGDAIKEFTLLATDMSANTTAAYKSIGLDAGKMSNQLLKGGPTAQAAFQKIVKGLLSIKDPTKQANTALAFFGTPLEDMNKADIPEFLRNMKSAGDGLGDVTGAADKAASALGDSASSKLEGFKRQVQMALVEKLADAIPYIEATFGWLSKNSDWVVPLATGLGIFAAAIYTITAAMKAWSAIQLVLNLELWSFPGTWIVLGILVLIAVIVLIATKTTWFQRAWKETWGFVKDYFQLALNFIITVVTTWWAVFSGFWKKVGEFFVWLWNAIVADLKAKWSIITDTFGKVVGFVEGLKGRIGAAAIGMWDGIKNSFKSAVNWLIGKWNSFQLTLGGGSVLGMNIPSVSLNTPDIPMLAGGGIVPATPGGTLALIGEGRHDEAVVPLPSGARAAALGGGQAPTLVLQSDGTRIGDLLIEILRMAIRLKGGNVQKVLGRKGAAA